MRKDPMERSLRVWLIDDSPDPHAVAEATVRGIPGVLLDHFTSGSEAIDAFTDLVKADPGLLPEVVLMDYFIGDERGDVVTVALRRLEPPGAHPTIVGYSSVQSGSERIVEYGGDRVVRKQRAEDGTNPSLRRFLLERKRMR